MTRTPQAHHSPSMLVPDRSVDSPLPAALTDLGAALAALAAAQQEVVAAAAVRAHATAVLDLLPDTCLVTDGAGHIHEANRATSSLIGYARRYVLGKPLGALVAPEGQASFAQLLVSLAPAPAARHSSLTLPLRPRRSAAALIVRVWVRPVVGVAGLERGLLWLLRDVTTETATAATYAQLQADQARQLRTRTMELEAVLRMRDATLAAERTTVAALLAQASATTADPPATVLARLVAGLQHLVTSRAPLAPTQTPPTEDA